MNRLTAKAKAIAAKVNDLSLSLSLTKKGLLAKVRLGFFFRALSYVHTTAVQELHKLLFGKNVSDSASASDSVAKEAGKGLSEAPSAVDSASLEPRLVKADSSSLTDSHAALVGKALSEQLGIGESQAFSVEKALADSVYSTDDVDGEASIDDDQEIHFMKVRADSGTIAESATLSASKPVSDSSSASDSGTYRGQGYCAFDYFEEDYVGYSGSF